MATSVVRIKELLGSGLENQVVARAVGVTDGYITQLMSDEAFAEEVSQLRLVNLTANNNRDKVADSIEDSLLEALKDAVETKQLYKPRDILHAYAVVNKATRRGVPATSGVTINATVVNLQLPQKVVENFTINQQGEVVGVGEQTLVTMPSHILLKNLTENKVSGHEQYERISRYLPAAVEDKRQEKLRES